MDQPDLVALLHRSESETLDFKSKQYPFAGASDEEKGELLKDILAMANAWKESNAYIVIGVEEEHGLAKRVCGADASIGDADLQQFINSKTNRTISLHLDVLKHKGKSLTIIQIHNEQDRPFYLSKNYGRLKHAVVYIRRGSSTAEATPDEIADMGREISSTIRSAEKAKARQEQLDEFWRELTTFLDELAYKAQYLRSNTSNHVYDNVFEDRLPLQGVTRFRDLAKELGLDSELRRKLDKTSEDVRVIDEYISMGAAQIEKARSNFRYRIESVITGARELKEKVATLSHERPPAGKN